MQRLFSTFADGWPGVGLLLQRLLIAIDLLYFGIRDSEQAHYSSLNILHVIGAATGILLLLGLWTPIAGTLVALIELFVVFLHTVHPGIHLTLATLGATLAMIGPGAWSIDARLFGRKHFED